MPEEIEVPTEQLHETLHEKAHEHEHAHGAHGSSWNARVALSSAIIAVLAAVGALLAGHHANEAMLEQMKATDQWAYYQAKGIKAEVIQSRIELLERLEKKVDDRDAEAVKREAEKQEKIKEAATELEHSSEGHMARHMVLARSVTTFQVAIAMAAISVLTKKRAMWLVGLVLGAIGTFFLVQSLV